jgi:DNA polymerase-3 subunit epsilon
MNLNLKKDIIFYDIEATGLNVLRDRIIQIAMIKYFADGRPHEEREYLVNPGIPISDEAMAVHGITPADVANKPTFQQLAEEIYKFIGEADLAGYHSNHYDLPMLMEEFARCGFELDLEGRNLVDVQRIFYKMEPRTLGAAHRYYCGSEMAGAHDALSDVKATIAVLDGQRQMYDGWDMIAPDNEVVPAPVKPDADILHAFTNDMRTVDATKRLKYDHNDQIVFNFGKHMGKPAAKTLYEDKQYYNWILNKEFSFQLKQIVRKLVKDYETELDQKNG